MQSQKRQDAQIALALAKAGAPGFSVAASRNVDEGNGAPDQSLPSAGPITFSSDPFTLTAPGNGVDVRAALSVQCNDVAVLNYRVLRDAVQLGATLQASTGAGNVASFAWPGIVDLPGAGPHVYHVEVSLASGPATQFTGGLWQFMLAERQL